MVKSIFKATELIQLPHLYMKYSFMASYALLISQFLITPRVFTRFLFFHKTSHYPDIGPLDTLFRYFIYSTHNYCSQEKWTARSNSMSSNFFYTYKQSCTCLKRVNFSSSRKPLSFVLKVVVFFP